MRQGTVLIVDKTDLLKSAANKDLNDITIYDFKLDSKIIQVSGIIIYVTKNNSKYKVLKSRYF